MKQNHNFQRTRKKQGNKEKERWKSSREDHKKSKRCIHQIYTIKPPERNVFPKKLPITKDF